MSKLLIVDDERSLREVLQVVFKKEGYSVALAVGYQDALLQLKSNVFDLVISDIKMKDGSGIDLLRDVKSASAETLVVMMTAYASVKFRWVPSLALAAATTLFCVLVFVKGLGIPLPIIGRWFAGWLG